MVSVDRDEDKRCPIDMVGRCRSGGYESPAGAFSAPTSCVTPRFRAATGVRWMPRDAWMGSFG